MWNNFFKHIDIHPENTHILDGNAADLQVECDAFEEKIRAAGGIELFVGGEHGYIRETLERGGRGREKKEKKELVEGRAGFCRSYSLVCWIPALGKREGEVVPPHSLGVERKLFYTILS